jgi:bifunctional non-homologous end joining protein LigD
MHVPQPSPLRKQMAPFDDPEWIYEIKHDGSRALAVIEHDTCRFFSRKSQRLAGYRALGKAVAEEVKARTAILDGELVVTDPHGRTLFAPMMKGAHDQVLYFAFDVLWLDGKDLRLLPLLRRKSILKRILPPCSQHILYVDHIQEKGRWLFQQACKLDLEGIVAKHATSPYRERIASDMWIKIKNPAYSQKEGRGDWFKSAG